MEMEMCRDGEVERERKRARDEEGLRYEMNVWCEE
jgi:hypothetical protein